MSRRAYCRWPIARAALAGVLLAGIGWSPASGEPPVRVIPIAATATTGLAVPVPHPVQSRRAPRRDSRTALVPHAHAPFPYDGLVPGTGKPFMEESEDGRRGRRTARRILWEDETFADNRVLLHIPGGFDARRPGLIVVYFHGHGASLETDVAARQQLPRQISRSGANAVLVAPQFAVNAPDSSIGKLWQPGGLARLLQEAATNLASLHGDSRAAGVFQRLPVVIVAYSGGYVAAAWSAQHGGIGRRLTGMVLLDALYGEADRLSEWIAGNPHGFLISAYADSTRRRNELLAQSLAERRIGHTTFLEPRIAPGTVAFLDAGIGASHRDFVTEAWAPLPVADVLARLPGFRRH